MNGATDHAARVAILRFSSPAPRALNIATPSLIWQLFATKEAWYDAACTFASGGVTLRPDLKLKVRHVTAVTGVTGVMRRASSSRFPPRPVTSMQRQLNVNVTSL